MEKKKYVIFSVSSVYIILRDFSFYLKKSFFCMAFISEKFKIALSVIYLPNIPVKVGFQLPIS